MIHQKFVFIPFIILSILICYPPHAIAENTGQNTFNSPTLAAKFVLIPAGTFMMGSPGNEQGRDRDESPQHPVTISRSFYMQTTEVTQWQWKQVMIKNPSSFSGYNDSPVESVSWNEVQEFIRQLNLQEGGTTANRSQAAAYRLPTEAEWEYAARAGTKTPFYTGRCLSTNQANYSGVYPQTGCPRGGYRQKTIRVMSFPPNAWGLYDMYGNVWEWVQDWYGAYPAGSVTDPQGPSRGSHRVSRGGSWFSDARLCRSAVRGLNFPVVHSRGLGFRLVRTR